MIACTPVISADTNVTRHWEWLSHAELVIMMRVTNWWRNGPRFDSFNVALRPQRTWGLLGTESPGRTPKLSHSSWALVRFGFGSPALFSSNSYGLRALSCDFAHHIYDAHLNADLFRGDSVTLCVTPPHTHTHTHTLPPTPPPFAQSCQLALRRPLHFKKKERKINSPPSLSHPPPPTSPPLFLEMS